MVCLGLASATAQEPLTNGFMHVGEISPAGDSDSWTFSANLNDSIVIRVGQISETNDFRPRIRLINPAGNQQSTDSGDVSAEVIATVTNSGTFTVVIDDLNGTLATGTYRLTLAKTPAPVSVAAQDQGGALTNGVLHTGAITTGDLDVWTFEANAGDGIVLRVGETLDVGSFTPWLRVYNPNGGLADAGFGGFAGEVALTAAETGTYVVVITDGNASLSGTGNYQVTLARTGVPVTTSSEDQGGSMTNGAMHIGLISRGDLDVWTFTATAGDSIVARAGEITDTNSFTPWVRIFSPSGVRLGSGFGGVAGEVTVNADVDGEYLVVVGDANSSYSGMGAYRLTLAKNGASVTTSIGDQGGALTNGWTHGGGIPPGDLDLWTIEANAGEALIVRAGELTDTNSFTPWIRLYAPNGTLVGSGFGGATAEAVATATNAGSYLVVIGDGNSSRSGSGTYRLTLARTGQRAIVTPGDEGGGVQGVPLAGVIGVGDLDVFTFSACVGEKILLQLDETLDSGNFSPWLRVYAPNGALLGNVSGAAAVMVSLTATNAGRYLVLVGDGNASLSGLGSYQLTVNGLTESLRLCPIVITGGNVRLNGVGGDGTAPFRILTSTNLALPTAFWTPLVTNQFTISGAFNFTNQFSLGDRQRFYRISSP